MSVRYRRILGIAALAVAVLAVLAVALLRQQRDEPDPAIKTFAAAPSAAPDALSRTLAQEGYAPIEGQTYRVSLEEWDDATFVAAKRVEGRAAAALFLADEDGRITYRFPAFYGNDRGALAGIRTIGFRDANHDGLTDVIVIADYVTGTGNEGGDAFPIASVYLRDGQSFRSLPTLDLELNETGQNGSVDVVLENVEGRMFRTSTAESGG